MSYKNKTYIAFDADNDMRYYRLMTAWNENENIDFNFHNAHDLNNLKDGSSEETIKRKLKERLNNTKQMILLVGDSTKNLFKYVRWEIEIAMSLDIPIIAVNLDGTNRSSLKTPPILKNKACFLSTPFKVDAVKYALDNFPKWYHENKQNGKFDGYYKKFD